MMRNIRIRRALLAVALACGALAAVQGQAPAQAPGQTAAPAPRQGGSGQGAAGQGSATPGAAAQPQGARQGGAPNNDLGYTDTPMVPGLPYHVHDPARPKPPVVTPGDQPGAPPSDAIVLFDGKDLSKWTSATVTTGNVRLNPQPAGWKVENGYFEVVPRAGNIATKESFGDMQLHVEWASPAVVAGRSQGRGNSGIFLMGVFEVQVLDGYDNPTYWDGVTGAVYGQWPPMAIAVRKPGEWQTYDIVFEAPRMEGEKVIKPAYVTVMLNGVILHNRRELLGPTVHRQAAKYNALPAEGPIALQDHGNPTRFRNIWVRRLGPYDQAAK